MIINDLSPVPLRKVQFKLKEYAAVPKESGCYVLTSFSNDILYIGLAKNLNARFQQHLDNPEKTSVTSEGKAIWFYFLNYDAHNLERLERSWMNQFSILHARLPILNKINSPIH